MGYTSGATMDQRGLRDVERWRDKIEVRLDNRQVFFLFFGSALVACLLFVLGVVVGKRLESRGRAVAPEVEDPLALLDKVATTPRPTQTPAVTFPLALFGARNGQAKRTELNPVEPKATDSSKGEPENVVEAGKPSAKTSEPGPAASIAPDKTSTKTTSKLVAKLDRKPAEPAKPAEARGPAARPAPAPTQAVAPKPALTAAAPAPNKPAVATQAAQQPAPSTNAPVPVIGAAATDSAKGKVRFTLQLSSFQSRAEAEAFAAKFGTDKPYLVVSEIPGKGTWYRVRVGDFATAKDAIGGKLAFEKKHGVIAYVAQR